MTRAASIFGDEPGDRLIAAAAALCTEFGYDEIDIETIAERAGVSREQADRLFAGGKGECLAAAENAILLEVVAAVSRGYSGDRSDLENVIHGVKALLELMAENPDLAYLGYIFSRQMATGSMREANQAGHRMLEAMLERGWEYSASSSGPATAALGVLGGAQAIVRRELAMGRASRLPQLLPDCVYIATVPFLGQREALRLVRQAEDLLAAP